MLESPPDYTPEETRDSDQKTMKMERGGDKPTIGKNNSDQNAEPVAEELTLQPDPHSELGDWQIKEARERLGAIRGNAHPAAQKLMDRVGHEVPLGDGAEKVVYPYGDEKVVAFLSDHPAYSERDHSPEAMKVTYYQQKLLHLLLPENIPDIHLAGSSPPMLIMDKIERPTSLKEKVVATIKRPFSRFRLTRKLNRLGIYADTSPGNFVSSAEGVSNYVDTFSWLMDGKTIERSMRKLPAAEQAKAKKYLSRLETLGEKIY